MPKFKVGGSSSVAELDDEFNRSDYSSFDSHGNARAVNENCYEAESSARESYHTRSLGMLVHSNLR